MDRPGPGPKPESKPHAVLIPYPSQGHVTPMLTLAKLLHNNGFHVTFVNTEFNNRRLVRSGSLSAVADSPELRFETIPDGLPPSDADATQDIPSLSASTAAHCLEPFCELISKLNNGAPPVSCIVSDGAMTFTLAAAERFRLPEVLFWTSGAAAVLGYAQYRRLVEKGYVPLKDARHLTDGYLETIIDWAPGMSNMRLRDFPSFIRTTDPNDTMLNFIIQELDAAPRAKALILNTFDALDHDVLRSLSAVFQRIYTIGPLHLLMNHVCGGHLNAVKSSLWKEDSSCVQWLDTKEPESVIYVNFGSITIITPEQLVEFAWGLANSMQPFLWIIRPGVVISDSAMLPPEFLAETKDRSLMIDWCPQEQVLKHPAVGGFLTHCGWNSMMESIASGVPVICWPVFADQQTNCRRSCMEWGIGMEMEENVNRKEVEAVVKEVMNGYKGKKMKENSKVWKKKAEEAVEAGGPDGSSYSNFNELINQILLSDY